uniref:Transposase domain-containing protein n=1 Tax=Anopheles atroparvus TaxID=41427 RepID=A0AAG5DCT9_ANOAO
MPKETFFRHLKKTGALYRAIEENDRKIAMEAEADGSQAGPSETVSQSAEPVLNIVSDDAPGLSEIPVYDDFEDAEEDTCDSDTDEEEDEVCFERMSLADCIRFWALSTDSTHYAINLLMRILRVKMKVKLPKHAKTLLHTNRNCSLDIVNINGGKFWYNGIQKCLVDNLRDSLPTMLSLNISIDGLPLYNNSTEQFWPILLNIHEMPQIAPMTVAIFCGLKKPDDVEHFLRPFVQEMNYLSENGLMLNDRCVPVKLRAIIADSPARAFVKGVVNFNGQHGCIKCTTVGVYNREGHTVIFKELQAQKRQDAAFRAGMYQAHQKTLSPIIDLLNFNTVEDVVVGDRLHLIDLGVMKRLLLGWRDGTLGLGTKWTADQIDEISKELENIKLPSEIHRKFRPMKHMAHWKGSEFSAFLHYASLDILQNYISKDEYEHFMLFFCAVSLLSSDVYRIFWELAGPLLEKFVKDFRIIYGERYLTSNIHNLLHVTDEVERFGPLPSISAYPFENKLQHLKRLVRSGWKSLEQVVNRLSELENFCACPLYRKPNQRYPYVTNRGDVTTVHISPCFQLQNRMRNEWFLNRQNRIMQFISVTMDTSSELRITCKRVSTTFVNFNQPFSSRLLYIFKGKISQLSVETEAIELKDIKCKLVRVSRSDKDEMSFLPLLHSVLK